MASKQAGQWRFGLLTMVASLAILRLAACSSSPLPPLRDASKDSIAGTSANFELVGHNALMNRGMNSAMAMFGHYVYIGSRTDGSPQHLMPGVQVVDVADPAAPKVVGEISLASVDPQLALGYTSRELRVWPQQSLLMVMYFGCSAVLHACISGADASEQPFQEIAFFDLSGANAAQPKLVSLYKPSITPHEMFLWTDPLRPERALLYWTSPNDGSRPLVVTDISQWRTGVFREVAGLNVVSKLAADAAKYDLRLHSISVSPRGDRVYYAHLGGGFLVVDSSDLANNLPSPKLRLVTPGPNHVYWDNQGAHSAVKLPGTHYVLTTEEIYGSNLNQVPGFAGAFGGCPWGWVRIIDIADETRPALAAEYRIAENQADFCAGVAPLQDAFSSYASHNPTVLHDLAFLTWHSGGLRAIDLQDPLHPSQAGFFLPTPEALSVTPDPMLEPGSNNIIAWSYPIIRDGLIYFMDIRNGLYIVRYTGRGADQVAQVGFLEGNSSLGDTARLDGAVP